jgi:hypothetical protein
MKRIKFTRLDKALMVIYTISLAAGVVGCFFAKPGELAIRIPTCIWILNAIAMLYGFKAVSARVTRLLEAANKIPSEIGQKAVNSAPSNLNTYEKGVYEEGFKDGVNYIRNEMNSNY